MPTCRQPSDTEKSIKTRARDVPCTIKIRRTLRRRVVNSTPSGICLTIAVNCILYVNNVTVPTRTGTHSRSTWPSNIHQLQHKPQKQVQDQVSYVANVTCTVKQWLVLRFTLLLIKRHHVRTVHRNSSMLPAGTSTST